MAMGLKSTTHQRITQWRAAGGLAALAVLAACGGPSTSSTVGSAQEAVMIQKGTYVYDPSRRHAPVSLSGADLVGLEPR
jgi:plastocyanin